MTACVPGRIAPLTAALLLVACRPESNPVEFRLQAMSFARSEWSEPVLLDAPVNSRCQDQTPTMSKGELSLYFLSDRPGGFGNLVSATGCMDNNDLCVARRSSPDGAWETAVNLRPPINTARSDGGRALSPDAHLLFLSSDRATAGPLHDPN